jgi:hypothetical protein
MLNAMAHNFIYSGWSLPRTVTCKRIVHSGRPRGREAIRG